MHLSICSLTHSFILPSTTWQTLKISQFDATSELRENLHRCFGLKQASQFWGSHLTKEWRQMGIVLALCREQLIGLNGELGVKDH